MSKIIQVHLDLVLAEVESSAIAQLGYDASARTVAVVFHSNLDKAYLYEHVFPPIEGESIGKWYHRCIRARGIESSGTRNLKGAE